MYLKDGREIYESDKYPGYYIDANTGAFCDERGTYIGGNSDNGDKPGGSYLPNTTRVVWVSKTGTRYYPNRTVKATIAMSLSEVKEKDITLLIVIKALYQRKYLRIPN